MPCNVLTTFDPHIMSIDGTVMQGWIGTQGDIAMQWIIFQARTSDITQIHSQATSWSSRTRKFDSTSKPLLKWWHHVTYLELTCCTDWKLRYLHTAKASFQPNSPQTRPHMPS